MVEHDAPDAEVTRLRVATWNQDYWKRTPEIRAKAWEHLEELGVDVALLQECVPPASMGRDRCIWREIGGHRRWGSAVVAFGPRLDEITHARSRYATHAFSLLQTYPGAVAIARVCSAAGIPVTVISVYGLMDPYAQTTLFRMIADLIPLFDSVDGRHVIVGGDWNITPVCAVPVERARYAALFSSIESLGLVNLFRCAKEKPTPAPGCQCGNPEECWHVQTFRHADTVGTPRESEPVHLDHLFATPELARCCERLSLDPGDPGWALSDHRALVADFDLAQLTAERRWDSASLTSEIERVHGTEAARVANELLDWAEKEGLRLHFEDGVTGQCWAQLDEHLGSPQYTFSVKTSGELVLQLQYLKEPFDSDSARHELLARLNKIAGIAVPPERIRGRPSVALNAIDLRSVPGLIEVFASVVRTTRAARTAPRPRTL